MIEKTGHSPQSLDRPLCLERGFTLILDTITYRSTFQGKIHCSCWMCRRKSYDELSGTDKRKQEAYRQQLEEMANEDTDTDQETDKAPAESLLCSEKEYMGQC